MLDTGLIAAQIAFLLLLYLFVWRIVRSSSKSIEPAAAPQQPRRSAPPVVTPVASPPPAPAAAPTPAAASPPMPAVVRVPPQAAEERVPLAQDSPSAPSAERVVEEPELHPFLDDPALGLETEAPIDEPEPQTVPEAGEPPEPEPEPETPADDAPPPEPVAEAATDTGSTRRPRSDSGVINLSNLAPKLVVEESPALSAGEERDLAGGLTIGRSSSADMPVDDPFVSHMHARILRRGAYYFVEDLGSTNGTFLNDNEVHRDARLKVRDTLRIGQTVLRYEE